jgi:hypothetical protein
MEVAPTSASPETLSRLLLISPAKADVGTSRSKLNASVGRTDFIVIPGSLHSPARFGAIEMLPFNPITFWYRRWIRSSASPSSETTGCGESEQHRFYARLDGAGRDCRENLRSMFPLLRMETLAVLFVGSVFLGILATLPFVRLQQLFKRSHHPAPLDGHERVAIRERNWYRKTEDEKLSAQKALS